MKRLILTVCALLLITSVAMAQKTITLTLTDSINPVGTKYYCYHRMTGGTYSSTDRQDLGTSKTYAWTIANPALGTHYFACTAYVVDGDATMESSFSNDFTWVNGPAAPTLSGLVAAVSRKEATLLASSAVPMTTTLAYGSVNKPYSKTITVSRTAIFDHEADLTKLSAKTTYLYRWTGKTTDGVTATFEGQFTTQ